MDKNHLVKWPHDPEKQFEIIEKECPELVREAIEKKSDALLDILAK
jgi:hypothetical protein